MRLTQDKFLDGNVTVRQPASGFRSGLEAVMLAAAVPAHGGDEVLELGAGAGVASLCLAARVEGCDVTGVEIDPELVALAADNAAANGLSPRVRFVAADVLSPPSALRRQFAHVFSNPPFHSAAGERSRSKTRERAIRDTGRFSDWLAEGAKRTVSGGTFTVILRADRLREALAALPERGIVIYPFYPREGEAALRVIVRLRKQSRAPLVLSPGLVLHDARGGFTPGAEAVLRGGRALALAGPRLYGRRPPRRNPES